MSTDFRALCADLLKAVDDCDDYTLTEGATVARARAALAAEADGPAVPEGREPASVVGQPSDELVAQWIAEVWHEGTPVRVAASDLHLASRAAEWGARYAHQPAPPAAVAPGPTMEDVGPLIAWLTEQAHQAADASQPTDAGMLTWAAQVIGERVDEDAPVPPAAGEAERAVADLRECADLLSWLPADGAEPMRRAADLLEQRHPAPVPVAERLQQLEDLAADAVSGLRYIEQTHGRLYGVGWDRVYEKADRLQPGHALPLPAGEVRP